MDKKKRKKIQIIKIRNKTEDITINSTEIKRIMRVQWTTVHKLDDLDEIDKFLEKQNWITKHKTEEMKKYE